MMIALVLAALAVPAAAAQSAAPTAALPEAHSPDEEQALEQLSDGLMVSARTTAERVLRAQPSSVVGHFVLGRVLFDAEGSLARAMYHLGRARELYETPQIRGGLGTPFHQELIFQIARLAGQLELYDYQLELLGFHDALYDPDLVAERCWPLMKLGRAAEARQFADVAVHSPNAWQRSAGLNALCALEGEARAREPYFAACAAALEDARHDAARHADDEEQAGIAVDAYNAALAAAAALRFGEAESIALEGVHRFEPTGADPWQLLVELYLSEGRTDDALGALGSMIHWNDRQPASLRDQGRAEQDGTLAIVFLLAGETERALERLDRALARPDRRGLTTDGAEQARGRHALVRLLARRTLAGARAEEASWTGRLAQLSTWLGSLGAVLDRWPDQKRVAAVLADERRLVDSVRPYVPGSIAGLSPWLVGELVDVVGPGVFAVALASARAAEGTDPRATPFYDALDAELALRRGDADALDRARAAMSALEAERGWALVRARLAALAAAEARDQGRRSDANDLFATVLELDPGVLRRLELPLPVRISSAGAEADEAALLLGRSPRFDEEAGFFEVVVTPSPAGLRACLRTDAGNEIRCAEARRPPPPQAQTSGTPPASGAAPEAEDPAIAELSLPQRLAREVHRQFFSARIALSRVDMSSLDGHTVGGSELAEERLREVVAPAP